MTTPTPNNEPRFGARSDSWQQEGNGVPQQQTPWPQYGQSTSPAQGAPQGGTPYPGAAQGPYPGGPAVMPPVKLPSRAPSVLMIIFGIIMMLIIAPIVTVSTMVGSLIGSGLEGSQIVTNGDTVTVSESGGYTLQLASGSASSCALTDSSNNTHAMNDPDGSGRMYSTDGLTPGQYTVECEGISSTTQMTGMPIGFDQFTRTGVSGLGWGSAVGVAGLILLIVGIVLLVRVNRKRTAAKNAAMMASIRQF